MKLADARKADAIARRNALGRSPTIKELKRVYRSLGPEDRHWVVRQLPAVAKLIPRAARLLEKLARGPEQEREGLGL
jgi:hypothetical protein